MWVRSPGSLKQVGGDRRPAEVPHRFQCPAFDGPAGADDRHPLAQPLGFGEDVAGQQHGGTAITGLGDALLKDVLHQRVQATTRLVEEQQPGLRGEGGDQRDLLPVALGVGTRLLVRVELEAVDQFGASLLVDAAAHAGQQVDGLAAGQVRPERDIARDIGDLAVQVDRVGPGVAAQQTHGPAVGFHHAQQDPDGGRLSGSVGSEEAVHLALADRQLQAVERARLAESLCQFVDLNRLHLIPPSA